MCSPLTELLTATKTENPFWLGLGLGLMLLTFALIHSALVMLTLTRQQHESCKLWFA